MLVGSADHINVISPFWSICLYLPVFFTFFIFVRDGIISVADYNSTRVGVVVVVVNTFLQWDNLRTL